MVLPLRCVRSKHVGGESGFDSLLHGLGLRELMPKRLTPRLIFYVLGRAPEAAEAVAGVDKSWQSLVRAITQKCMDDGAKQRFRRDYSAISPTEFSASLSEELLPSPKRHRK